MGTARCKDVKNAVQTRHSRSPHVILMGKQKNSSSTSTKKGPKKSLLPTPSKLPYLETSVVTHNLLLAQSFYQTTGRPILEDEIDISMASKALYEAPFALLAHDTSEPEPVFVYGNNAALNLFECTWEELIGTPSSKSADPNKEIQSERSELLAQVLDKGHIDGYTGWRRTFQGKSFRITDATVFNVSSPPGERIGQAAMITKWEFEDGTEGGVGVKPAQDVQDTGSRQSKGILELEVEEQAALVRQLKENQGLKNSDPLVKEAVAVLLHKKEELAKLQG